MNDLLPVHLPAEEHLGGVPGQPLDFRAEELKGPVPQSAVHGPWNVV